MSDQNLEQGQTTIVEEQNQELTNQQGEPQSIDIEKIKQEAAREVASQFISSLGEKDRQIAEMRAQLERSQRAAPVVEEEIDGATFLESPSKHMRNLIKKEMENQMQPVQQLLAQFNSTQQATQIKRQLSTNPAFKEIISTYEDVIDQLVGAAVTPQNYQSAVLMIPGLIQTGQIANRGTNTPSTPAKGGTIPATIPPSAPAAPIRNKPQELSITETERNIARRMGVTPEEFVRLRDADSSVDSFKRPEKK